LWATAGDKFFGEATVKTDEIIKLSREALLDLIETRLAHGKLEHPFSGSERRRTPRWPFPGQVEVRPEEGDHGLPEFVDCRDLNETGMGMCGEAHYPIGTTLELSVHLPEKTLYGRGVVRYSMRTPRGHMMGVEFVFDD
jgi:hypothetical protein